jgi:hypothetical protein
MDWRVILRISVIAVPLAIIGTIYVAPAVAAFVYHAIVALAPLWLPVGLAVLLWPLWLTFIRSQYVSRIEYVTLELKPGDNTPKTARPMELIFYSLYYRTEITRQNALLKGIVRVPWCFEIHATKGIVRFYIHVPKQHRPAIEGRIRAEYRDIDIDEARDYTRERAFNPFEMRLAVREYTLSKNDAYPIRTYVAHEQAKERRDVFSELLEDLTATKEGEELWISLMVRPHQRDWGDSFLAFLDVPRDTLHQDAHEQIHSIIGSTGDVRHATDTQKDLVTAIEEALKKPSFDCGLRVMYVADRSVWNDSRADGLDHLFDRFGDHTLNGFSAYDPRDVVTWPLTDIFVALPALRMEYFLKMYRQRAFFSPPYYGRAFVLNTEELATMFHMPKVGRASALSRSRGGARLEPPDNLPV